MANDGEGEGDECIHNNTVMLDSGCNPLLLLGWGPSTVNP